MANDPAHHGASETEQRTVATGLAFGLAAYGWWGAVMPVYFHTLRAAGAWELLAQRVVFGLPILLLLLALRKRLGRVRAVFRDPKLLRLMLITTVLIAINWAVFVYSAVSAQLLAASFGYYINPLFSVALGFVFLGERPSRWGWVSIVLAVGACVYLGSRIGLPWISVTVALSFGTYGLLRKRARVDSLTGLTVEMIVLLPFMIGLLAWIELGGGPGDREPGLLFGRGALWQTGLMLLGGVVTVVPLTCFTAAARRLELTTVGLLQYLAPTGQFVTALALTGEAFDRDRAIAFGVIWVGLAIFTTDAVRRHRLGRRRVLEMAE
ncbi:MAG: EamA family transporter RarD [Phycisphaerales bacterium JB040]